MRKFTQWLLLAIAALVAFPTAATNAFIGGRDDFRDETIYFVMTTRFYDGDPKNNVLSWDKQDVQMSKNDPDWRGDFAGLIKKLDYIKALGFTAIWITPIVQNASGEDYHGYHSMDFSSVDLRYESRKEWGCAEDVKFENLIKAAHEKEIKIILDIVLQHTSNFGEVNLNPLFTRNQKIWNQATPAGSLIPNSERLSNGYFEQTGNAQYQERFKFFKNPEYDKHNYYHHYGTGWNWDLPNRWWGQIAGDCVDLNTENNTVAEYMVKCYGDFIKMGVDGFRIDTTGHIAPLTFNKQFIPQLHKIAEDNKGARLNAGPFYMFGECCARFGSVIYRDQHNLSSHFYTWKSPQALLDAYDGSQAFWDTQYLVEGHDSPVGPMVVCEQDKEFNHSSDNVFMQNGRWHEPNYSEASGLNVIDFPMHYNFNGADQAINIAKQGDKYYNDASYNVVYVDSHDYCPGPNDGTRFNGGTAQWAENLSLMFTFRGIPCIYYGSEVEFKKGKPIDVGGDNNKTPRSESGRAYFGNFIEGQVDVEDFGKFTFPDENANIAKTLNADLAQHIIRLNQIRAAVPALRKGQYTFDGCQANGGWAYKRAYKDSYACVALNGGGTFSNLPKGKYKELVTGEVFDVAEGGSLTINVSKQGKGQLRVAVKDYTGGIVGVDGKFIYKDNAVSRNASVDFPDPGTPDYYTADDVVGDPEVKFSPAGGSFRTETLSVTATPNKVCASAWYQIGNGSKQSIPVNSSKTFTVGEGMGYGESVTVTWGAKDSEGLDYTGKVTYKKVDPHSGITIYVKGMNGADISGTNLHAWTSSGNLNGEWPGKKMTDVVKVNGEDFYYQSFDVEKINIIFNRNGAQTANIEGIDGDAYFEYDGGTQAKKINPVPVLKATLSPKGGEFNDTQVVTYTVANATSAWYKIGNGSQVNVGNGTTTFTLGNGMNIGETVNVAYYATDGNGNTINETVSFKKVETVVVTPTVGTYEIYFDNNNNWGNIYAYCWDDNNNNSKGKEFSGAWPGKKLTETKEINGKMHYVFSFTYDGELSNPKIIIHDNGNNRAGNGDMTFENYAIYNASGNTGKSGVEAVEADDAAATVEYYNMQGIRVAKPTHGTYIKRHGSKVEKIYVR